MHCSTWSLIFIVLHLASNVIYDIVAISTFNNTTVEDYSWKNEFIIVVQDKKTFIMLHFHFIIIMGIMVSNFSKKLVVTKAGISLPSIVTPYESCPVYQKM